MTFHKISLKLLLLILTITFNISANAEIKIAILDFELNDITQLPYVKSEIIRTASFKPLLEQLLKDSGDYKIIQVAAIDYNIANAGLGYLYKFHDISASLGHKYNADWVIVGQHSKGSFLYSYLMVNLINTKTNKLVAHYDIELKGTHKKVTEHGIKALLRKIIATLNSSPQET